jgi:glutathione S-transferase
MLQLYGHLFSSYTWKALIPLYANETPFEFRSVDPGEGAENGAFVANAHPAGRFPVLVDGDTVVIEATSIVEYLALHYPGAAPLIPADPAAALTARMLDRVFDNYVMYHATRVVLAHIVGGEHPDQTEVADAKKALLRVYRWLEEWLGSNRLPPHVSLVTCAAAPALFYADWVEPIPDDHPRLRQLRAELLALPSVSRCVEDARPFRSYFPPGAPTAIDAYRCSANVPLVTGGVSRMAGHDGGCACGEVRYRLTSDPIVVHCCHCRSCQRESGTAFALNGVIEADRVERVIGMPERVDTPSASGKGQPVFRCPSCKVALWSHYAGAGEKACFIRVGTLDEPDKFPPDVHIFTDSKQPWVVLPEGAESFPSFYSGKDVMRIYGEDGAMRWRALKES